MGKFTIEIKEALFLMSHKYLLGIMAYWILMKCRSPWYTDLILFKFLYMLWGQQGKWSLMQSDSED